MLWQRDCCKEHVPSLKLSFYLLTTQYAGVFKTFQETFECNIKSKILKLELFALQVDESTDISRAKIFAFVRLIYDKAL